MRASTAFLTTAVFVFILAADLHAQICSEATPEFCHGCFPAEGGLLGDVPVLVVLGEGDNLPSPWPKDVSDEDGDGDTDELPPSVRQDIAEHVFANSLNSPPPSADPCVPPSVSLDPTEAVSIRDHYYMNSYGQMELVPFPPGIGDPQEAVIGPFTVPELTCTAPVGESSGLQSILSAADAQIDYKLLLEQGTVILLLFPSQTVGLPGCISNGQAHGVLVTTNDIPGETTALVTVARSLYGFNPGAVPGLSVHELGHTWHNGHRFFRFCQDLTLLQGTGSACPVTTNGDWMDNMVPSSSIPGRIKFNCSSKALWGWLQEGQPCHGFDTVTTPVGTSHAALLLPVDYFDTSYATGSFQALRVFHGLDTNGRPTFIWVEFRQRFDQFGNPTVSSDIPPLHPNLKPPPFNVPTDVFDGAILRLGGSNPNGCVGIAHLFDPNPLDSDDGITDQAIVDATGRTQRIAIEPGETFIDPATGTSLSVISISRAQQGVSGTAPFLFVSVTQGVGADIGAPENLSLQLQDVSGCTATVEGTASDTGGDFTSPTGIALGRLTVSTSLGFPPPAVLERQGSPPHSFAVDLSRYPNASFTYEVIDLAGNSASASPAVSTQPCELNPPDIQAEVLDLSVFPPTVRFTATDESNLFQVTVQKVDGALLTFQQPIDTKTFTFDHTLSLADLQGPSPGEFEVTVLDVQFASSCKTFTVAPGFVRGDSNSTGAPLEMVDATLILDFLFNNAPPPPCLKAADATGDDEIDIGDPLRILNFQFNGTAPPPPSPYPDPGFDPGDNIPCDKPIGVITESGC